MEIVVAEQTVDQTGTIALVVSVSRVAKNNGPDTCTITDGDSPPIELNVGERHDITGSSLDVTSDGRSNIVITRDITTDEFIEELNKQYCLIEGPLQYHDFHHTQITNGDLLVCRKCKYGYQVTNGNVLRVDHNSDDSK
jgi:hypothetical protein